MQTYTEEPGFSEVLARAENDTAQREDEYKGPDGLLRCKTCDGPRQTQIHIFDRDRVVRCACSCRKEEDERQAEQARHEARERRRRDCFRGTNMLAWSFDNDDGKRPDLSRSFMQYADDFADFRRDGKGLLLYGPVGTGKTYFAASIANRVIDRGYTARMTNFSQVSNDLQSTWEKQEYIDRLCEYDLLIFDDLGAERKSEYMQEQVFNVIDARYRSGGPVIITTNLTQDELAKPDEMGYSRIYDRILERCLPVKVDGQSRRRAAAKAEWSAMRERLGIGGVGLEQKRDTPNH